MANEISSKIYIYIEDDENEHYEVNQGTRRVHVKKQQSVQRTRKSRSSRTRNKQWLHGTKACHWNWNENWEISR